MRVADVKPGIVWPEMAKRFFREGRVGLWRDILTSAQSTASFAIMVTRWHDSGICQADDRPLQPSGPQGQDRIRLIARKGIQP
jgi:hypothetical protein